MERKWWMEAVGYQIYPKSFYDTNGDGIGDLPGIIEKLDYIKELGINLIWICPFYKSPMDDNGYDVSDYYDIDPMFGTLDDAKKLIEEAHKRDIKVVADLVLNHTSDEHPWFIESRQSKDNPKRDYYIWSEGKDSKEPNNWASFFGGSAWKKDEITGEYFMKIFSDKMPDLNWENKELREEMYKMSTWWLDLGIDGFRVDAVAHIARDTTFKDSELPLEEGYAKDWRKFSNLPDVHTHLKEFYREVLAGRDVMTVGEVGGGATPDEALEYVGYEANEFNMVFNFDHTDKFKRNKKNNTHNDIELIALKDVFNKWQKGLYGRGWNAIYWLNHDKPRLLSSYGDTKYYNESAKMLATALYFMWGTPFLYNGEEIGMTNYPFKSLDEFTDVAIHNMFEIAKENGESLEEYIEKVRHTSRDNARTPMQWNDSLNGGFTSGEPWMKVNPNYNRINVESQLNDPSSIFNYYKKVNNLRTNSEYKDIIVYGDYNQVLYDNENVYAYTRTYDGKTLLIITNFTDLKHKIEIDLDINEVILSNYEKNHIKKEKIKLYPYEALVCRVK